MAQPNPSKSLVLTAAGVLVVVVIILNVIKTVPVGHVGVATLFGEAQAEGYPEGLHYFQYREKLSDTPLSSVGNSSF